MGSFVENVNKLSLNLDTIVTANYMFDDSVLPVLQEVADLDLQEVTEDLKKGNYLGNRKIDVDLSLNKLDSTSIVSYSKADITLVSGEIISIPFLSGASVLELTSHNDIRNYIVNDVLWAGIQYTECTVEESTDTTPTLIRFRDADGHSSNIERVELTVYSGTAKDIRPVYFWAQTTSALQTIANRVGDIIALGNNMSNVIELSQRIDELNELQAELTNLLEIHSNLAEILEADTNAGIATTKAAEALASKIAALQALSDATTQSTIATNQAIIATNKANEIKSITTQTATGAAGSLAQVSYNSTDGKLSFVIPQGLKGDRGEAFSVNAMGTFAQRTGYDAQPINFSYFATDMSLIYFKQSATSGDWSTGIPFGKGDKGDIGLTGNGIATIVRISGTGAAGSADTYRITYTDGGTFDFTVWNGTESVISVNGKQGTVTINALEIPNTPTGNISSTNVQTALNELDAEKAANSTVIHKTGDETKAGILTLTDGLKLQGQNVSPFNGSKNYIINGNFDVWQRGTSFNGSSEYTADRWKAQISGDVGTKNRSTNVPTGYKYALNLSITGSSPFAQIGQHIEFVNFKGLRGKTATLSFWVKANNTNISSMTYRIRYSTNLEDETILFTGSTLVSGSKTVSTTWQQHTTSFDVPTGITSMSIEFSTGAVSNGDIFYITGVQLEEGSVATPFENRQYGLELSLCQRYYEVGRCIQQLGIGTTIGVVLTGQVFFKTSKRIVPTVTYLDQSGAQNKVTLLNNSGAETNGVSVIAGNSTNNDARLTAITTNTTQNGIGFTYTASAEL